MGGRQPRGAGLARRPSTGDQSPRETLRKSRLLDLIEALCHQPLLTTNASPSAVCRSIGADPTDPPTLLIDEADAIFGPKAAGDHEDLRGLINAGHSRNRRAIRWDAARRVREEIETFALVALAGIGDMPDTIEDRAVLITMRRRAPDELVQPYAFAAMVQPCTSSKVGSTYGCVPGSTSSAPQNPPCPLRTGPPTPGNLSSRLPTRPAVIGPTPPVSPC